MLFRSRVIEVTEATHRSVARGLAAKYYDLARSAEKREDGTFLKVEFNVFGKMFPTLKDYLSGKCHGQVGRTPEGEIYHIDDGSLRQVPKGELYFYELAREALAKMLGRNDITDYMKERIFEAIIEDRERSEERRVGKECRL